MTQHHVALWGVMLDAGAICEQQEEADGVLAEFVCCT